MRRAVIVALVLLTAEPASASGRPHAWCGWYMRQVRHVADARYNLARYWLHYGSPAFSPCVGCVVVWAHHVGEIVGKTATGWLVHSGNDGHRVRTRERSLTRAIGYRQ